MKRQEFGVVGLGRMGANLSLQAIEKGVRVVGYTLEGVSEELKKQGMIAANSLTEFKTLLSSPRVIFLYIPAGPMVDQLLEQLAPQLEKGDIILDGGNSYWGDSIRRHQKMLKEYGIYFLDLGTSGGVEGARQGACFMIGGERPPVETVEPLLIKLATADGYVHAGPPGAGHFTKLVHNGIEFGMLQAIGEGIDLLEHYQAPLPIADILKCWRHGSVIRSWLIDLMEGAYRQEDIKEIPAYVDDTGEVNWLVNDAVHMEVPIPVISLAVMQLFASRDNMKYWARAIAMMRHGFGGHPFGGPNAGIVEERRDGRIGGFYRDQT